MQVHSEDSMVWYNDDDDDDDAWHGMAWRMGPQVPCTDKYSSKYYYCASTCLVVL